jgi:hypothetical protein
VSVSLAWPSQLPAPLMETHGLQLKPALIRSEIERGAPAQRRRFQQTPTDVPFSCILARDQLAIFEAWVEYRARNGARWFSIDLVSGMGFSPHEARILSIEQYKELTPNRWRVNGVFEVRDREILTSDQLDLALEEDPYELLEAFGDFHTFVHSELGLAV